MGQGPLIEKAPVPVGLFVLILLTAVAFWPGLSAGFLYDDLRDVVENPAAQAETFAERLPQTVRPLLKASYALQDAMTGPSPFAFHAVNLGLHLATTLMVLALLRRAAGLAGHAADVAARIGWMAALVWIGLSLWPSLWCIRRWPTR